MQPRFGFLVLVLILCTGLALVLASGGTVFASATGAPPTLVAGGPGALAAAEGRGGEAALADGRADREAAQRDEVSVAGSVDGSVDGDALPLAPDQLLVRVVDTVTGAPVAEAEVVADDPKFRVDRLPASDRQLYQQSSDPMASLARWGQHTRTDARGRARLQRGSYLSVHAQKAMPDGVRYGTMQIHGAPPEGGYVLRLEGDLGVDVRVVDAQGKGLPGVPLSLTAEFVLPGAASGDRSNWPVATTDADGNAHIRHLQSLARDWQGRQPRDLRVFVGALGLTQVGAPVHPTASLAVAAQEGREQADGERAAAKPVDAAKQIDAAKQVDEAKQIDEAKPREVASREVASREVAGHEVASREVASHDGAKPNAAPVVLTIGAYGSIVVVVRDAKDRALQEHASLSVGLSARGREVQQPWDEVDMRGALVGGTVLFPYVGLGLQLEAQAWLDTTAVSKSFAGPVTAGERVEAQLSLTDARAICIRGRLVGADRAPREVDLMLMPAQSRESLGWLASKADGTFAWYGDRDAIGQVPSVRLVARDEQGRPCGSSAALPLPPGNLEIDLGDVVLQDVRTIARGRVTAWTSPPPQHTLYVETWYPPEDGGEGHWGGADSIGVVQEPDGAFAVTALGAASLAGAPPAAMRLSVEAPECAPVTPFEFAAGRQDLFIELQRGARLTVRIVLGPELARSPVDLSCHLEGRAAAIESYAEQRDGERIAEFAGLAPGDYRLIVRSHELTVATVDGLRLEPGRATDPRVDPLDLRGRLRPVRVRLLDAAGSVVDELGQLLVREGPGGAWHDYGWLEHGVALLAVVGAQLELAVLGPNLQPLHWQGPTADVDLHVARPFGATVEFAGLPAAGGANGSALLCQFELVAARFHQQHGLEPEQGHWGLDPVPLKDGKVNLPLREEGGYSVSLLLRASEQEAPEVLFTGRVDLSSAQPQARIELPAAVQQQLRERLRPR